jgi:putative NADH-flavin reductase
VHVAQFGASGRIGRLALAETLARGHTVTALVRDPAVLEPRIGLQVVGGDVAEAGLVASVIGGADAVIATLGPRSNTPDQVPFFALAARTIGAGMERQGVRRIVLLSGAAVDAPGDHKPAFDRFASRLVRLASGHVVGAKQAEFDIIRALDLDWTAVRPPIVTDAQATGRVQADPVRLKPGGRIGRADIAAFIVDQLDDRRFLRQAPFIWT